MVDKVANRVQPILRRQRALARNLGEIALMTSELWGAGIRGVRASASLLRRFAATDWKDRDVRLTAPPSGYGSQAVKLACFRAVRAATGESVGQKQIDRVRNLLS